MWSKVNAATIHCHLFQLKFSPKREKTINRKKKKESKLFHFDEFEEIKKELNFHCNSLEASNLKMQFNLWETLTSENMLTLQSMD